MSPGATRARARPARKPAAFQVAWNVMCEGPVLVRPRSAALCLVTALATAGCYLSHPPPTDAGPDARSATDAATDASPDGGDAGLDAGRDAGDDAGLDAGPTDPDSGGGCIVEPADDAFEGPVPEVIWAAEPAGPFPLHSQVCMTPVVVETDRVPEGGELLPEVIFTSYMSAPEDSSGVIRIIDPRTGDTIRSIPEDPVEALVVETTAHLAVGDLDGDGLPEIVALKSVFGSIAYHVDGTILWESSEPSLRNRGALPFEKAIAGAPSIADLDGDGTPEVIFGRVVLHGDDGTTMWTGEAGYGINGDLFGPIGCAFDQEGDGIQEVAAGNTLYEGLDGSVRWTADVFDGWCAIGDVLGDAAPEVVLVSSGEVNVLDAADGAVLWRQRVPGGGNFLALGGAPTIADFDADGSAEIAMANGASYVLLDPECRGEPAPAGCDSDGIRWSRSTEDDSSASTGSSVFDFNGDGASEAVYNDEYFFRIYDGATGTLLFQEPNSSRTRTEYPVIADVDGDGNAEIVFPANTEASFLDLDPNDERYHAGVEIWGDAYDRWVGTRRIWNQHGYSIDNVNEDGTIPARPAQGWLTHDSFRANRFSTREEELSASDVYVRLDWHCEGDRVVVLVTVRNLGVTRVLPGIRVSLYDGKPEDGALLLGEVVTTIALEGGGSQVLRFETDTPATQTVYAVADHEEDLPDGRERECNEGNNRRRVRNVSCE
jgi:outer membrane protein assembly factor BamB